MWYGKDCNDEEPTDEELAIAHLRRALQPKEVKKTKTKSKITTISLGELRNIVKDAFKEMKSKK